MPATEEDRKVHNATPCHPLGGTCRVAALACLSAWLLAGCLPEQAAPPAPPPPVPVTTFAVEARDTPVLIEFLGKTASSRRVEIRSRVQGFLESRDYVEGALVEEGQVMFQMDRKPFEAQLAAAQAELSQQEAKLTNADANLKRARSLAKTDAIAQMELDNALGTFRSTAAAVEAAKAKVLQAELDLSYTTIASPVRGISSFATQREGAYIGLGNNSLLTYVAQIDPIWVEFSVSENQILRSRANTASGRTRPPANGEYEVELVLADGSVFPQTGRITFADASLSERTGTFLLRAELPNPPRGSGLDSQLRPGQFVRVHLKGAIRPDAIVIPQRAVQQGAKGSFVWVVDEAGKASFRPVTVGRWQGDGWIVEQGLEDGETIVVDGALRLRAGAAVQVTGSHATDAAAG